MNVVVLAKWVPNPEGVPEMGDDFRLKREGAEGSLDPTDEFGVEAALQVAESQGGEVTVVSMGPESVATAAVRKALSMGAAKAVVVSDESLKGADTLVTARALSAAVQKQGFDLLIAGVESTDGYTGTLPMTIAELLGVPSVTFLRKLEVKDGKLHAERQTEVGYDVVEAELPAVVTVTAGATSPRYPTLKGIMQAKQKPLETLGAGDLDMGDAKPTQEVTAINPAPEKSAGEVVEDDGEGFKKIADFLSEAKVI
ncbi:MAG: electron transfer flavoprotein subunit alpha [Actinomycetota bacterium]